MSQEPAASAANAVSQVHQFGSASESVFRRVYHALKRRDDIANVWQEQQERLQAQAQSNASLQRQRREMRRALGARAEEIRQLHELLGSVSDGIILQDLNGKVTLMNATARTMLGGKRNFWHSELGRLFERFHGVRRTRGDLMPLGESAEIRLDQRVLRAQLAALGGEDGRRIGTVIILRDVTYDALAQRLKDGFVSTISRQMEKPLAVMKLAGELLDSGAQATEENRALLDKLLQNAAHVDRLGLELLDIAAIEAGSFDVKREPIDAEGLIWSVAAGMAAELRGAGIELQVMTSGLSSLRIIGDAARLGWALAHLLRNGAQYNNPGGYVALSAKTSQSGAQKQVRIRVSDNGLGISADELPQIFERSFRGRKARDQSAGLGQGLTVAKAICEAHRGALEARSREHVGSAFTLSLPATDYP